MIKNLILIIILTFSSLQNILAKDSSAVSKEIAVLDTRDILTKSEVGKYATKVLTKKRDTYQDEAIKLQKEIQKLDKELTTQKSVLSDQAFEKKLKKRDMRFAEINKMIQEKRYNFDKIQHQANNDIISHVDEIVQQIAKEKQLKLILMKHEGMVIFSDKSLDIGDEVLKKLNKKIKKLKINL